jgi:hypothetical protein
MKHIKIKNRRHVETAELEIPESLTEGQAITIMNILFNDYGDSERLESGTISGGQPWEWAVWDCGHVEWPENAKRRSVSGWVGSLSKAGLVDCHQGGPGEGNGHGCDGSTIQVSDKGLELIDPVFDSWDQAAYAEGKEVAK